MGVRRSHLFLFDHNNVVNVYVTFCHKNDVEDEIHFVLICPIYLHLKTNVSLRRTFTKDQG